MTETIRGAPSGRGRLPGALFLLCVLCVLCAGCVGGPDLSGLAAYYEREPRTILILPVENETTDAEAPRFFLATLLRPLAARGYYVLPPEAAGEVLAQEGLFEAGEAWGASPRRLHDHLGADAVLYITIEEWDTSYLVLATTVTVALRYTLVDCRSGDVIWENRARESVQSGGYSGDPIGALVVAVVDAAVTAAATDYVPLASRANHAAFAKLPPGVYHPGYEPLRRRVEAWKAKHAAEAPDVPGEG